MTTPARIAHAGSSDLLHIQNVARQAYLDHFTHLWSDGGQSYLDSAFSLENLSQDIADPNHRYFLATLANEPVGYMKLRLDSPLPITHQPALELERIYLLRAFAGRGVGSQFVDLAFREARRRGKSLLWLKVMDSSTESIAFYQKKGFEKCGETILDYPNIRPEFQGMWVMKKEIVWN